MTRRSGIGNTRGGRTGWLQVTAWRYKIAFGVFTSKKQCDPLRAAGRISILTKQSQFTTEEERLKLNGFQKRH